MGALAAFIIIAYFVGFAVSLFVFANRAGLNREAYLGAFMHPPSRRNGVPWVLKNLAKAYAWPLVYWQWVRTGKPPARTLFGPDAAEKLGHPGQFLAGFQTKWTDPNPPPEPTVRPPRPAARPLGTRGTAPARALSDDLDLIIGFGRHQFLGWEAAGEPGPFEDWYGRTSPWHKPLMSGPPASDRAIATLNRLATTHGGWVAIGAWKLLLEFSTSERAQEQGVPALRACVQAYEDFGVTNLSIHLGAIEMKGYQEHFGRLPTSDGFFGPPVFSTSEGPQKVDYLRAAAQAAAMRQPRRLAFADGVRPTSLPALGTTALWDWARLIVNGPLLVPQELRNEDAILKDTIAAVDGTDHRMVLSWLSQMLKPDPNAGWAALGAGRFCEECLHERLTGSPAHLALIDVGLRFLLRTRHLPSNISLDCLSFTEKERLRALT